MQVGDEDGHGQYGVLDEDADGLLCHECGDRFTHLGLHTSKAHGVTADEYRAAHGLSRRGLVVKATRRAIADNARERYPTNTMFVQRRNPAAATAARLERAESLHSPAGLEAMREANAARRGMLRLGTVVVCELCGFYARGAGQRGTTRKILLGQYLGFGGILLAAVVVSLGARSFLPEDALPYFGLLPLALGLYAAWRAWRNRGDDDDDDEAKVADKQVGVLTVAAVTSANGGDNIGVYVPVFATASTTAIIAYCLVFLALVGLLVLAAKYVATRRPIAEVLERWEHILFPLVLIGLSYSRESRSPPHVRRATKRSYLFYDGTRGGLRHEH